MSKNEVTVFEEVFLNKLAELEFGAAPSPAIDKLASAYGFDQGGDQGADEVTYESLLNKLAEDSLAVRPKGFKGAVSRGINSARYHGAKAIDAMKAAPGKAFGAMKAHPYRTAAGVAGAAGLGYAGYKAYKAMKSKKDDE
jgi:hypothetical protein